METGKRFKNDFTVNLSMNTFKQVVNPKFETTGGFKL